MQSGAGDVFNTIGDIGSAIPGPWGAAIGAGAKILGGITIANDVAIGANAVVVKDILEEATSHAGVPSKKVSNNSSRAYIDKRLFEND